MAFLNDIKTAIAAGSAQTLLTVPVGAEVAISTLFFNAVGGTANITLNLDRQASGTDVDLLEDYPITDDLPYHFPKPIMLQEGDVLTFSATGNNINGMVGYYQEGVATTTAGVLNPRGEYSGAAEYDRLDVVEEDGTSYIQLNDGISGDAPPSVNWMVLAKPPATYAWGDITDKPTLFDGAFASLTGVPKTFLTKGTVTGNDCDLSTGNYFRIPLDANKTITFSNMPTVGEWMVILDASGTRTVGFSDVTEEYGDATLEPPADGMSRAYVFTADGAAVYGGMSA